MALMLSFLLLEVWVSWHCFVYGLAKKLRGLDDCMKHLGALHWI